jgi:hypothetical protein
MKKVLMMVVAMGSMVMAQTEEPKALQMRRQQYEQKVKQVAEPYKRAYLVDLEMMKRNYGVQGETEAMAFVQKEIDIVKTISSTESSLIVGKWVWFNGVVVEFLANGTLKTEDGSTGTWVLTSSRPVMLKTNFSNDTSHEFILSSDGKVLNGTQLKGYIIGFKFKVTKK